MRDKQISELEREIRLHEFMIDTLLQEIKDLKEILIGVEDNDCDCCDNEDCLCKTCPCRDCEDFDDCDRDEKFCDFCQHRD